VEKAAPICLTLLICDQAIQDRRGGKVTLVGVFSSFSAAAFPATLAQCVIWIELTNGHGETPVVLRLVRVTPLEVDGEILLEARFTITFTDPRTIHRHQLSVAGLEFPAPGEYRLSLHAFERPLFERRLEVHRQQEPSA
jgi:hypothetical protein